MKIKAFKSFKKYFSIENCGLGRFLKIFQLIMFTTALKEITVYYYAGLQYPFLGFYAALEFTVITTVPVSLNSVFNVRGLVYGLRTTLLAFTFMPLPSRGKPC